MIGYKATYNGMCLNQLYKVGQTYTLEGELVMCEKGFHFCQNLYDVFTYYLPYKDIKVFKVEALGNIKTISDKSVTDKIKILEEVNLSNIVVEKNGFKKHFDEKCNLVKREYTSGYWVTFEYDSNDNKIKEEISDGSWIKYEYDSKNNRVKEEFSNGDWVKYEYDSNNNLIKCEESDGHWEKWEYNENSNYVKIKGYNYSLKP